MTASTSRRGFLAGLAAVTAEDVQRVAADIVREDRLNLAVIGPFKSPGRFERLLAFPEPRRSRAAQAPRPPRRRSPAPSRAPRKPTASERRGRRR